MKKGIILSIATILIVSSFVNAWEILLQPSNWKYSPWCMIGIDIIMDPEWVQISTTDIVIESSMKFIKFEPEQLLPYFFPPKVENGLVHIIGFTSWPNQRTGTKWALGKIFFKPKNKSDIDGSIKFYVKKKWDTTDTNLSIGWWVDVLEDTRNGFYTFNWDTCDYEEEEIISIEESSNIDYEKWIEKTMKKVEKEHKSAKIQKSREENKSYIIWLFIIVVILAAYFSMSKWKSKQA